MALSVASLQSVVGLSLQEFFQRTVHPVWDSNKRYIPERNSASDFKRSMLNLGQQLDLTVAACEYRAALTDPRDRPTWNERLKFVVLTQHESTPHLTFSASVDDSSTYNSLCFVAVRDLAS